MPYLDEKTVKELPPSEKNKPPAFIHEGEYWPNGHGATQLTGKKNTRATSDLEVTRSATSGQSPEMLHEDIAKRADSNTGELLELGEEGYPFPYSIDDMVKFYGDIQW